MENRMKKILIFMILTIVLHESNEEDKDTSQIPRAMVVVAGEPLKLENETKIECDYTRCEDFNLCSSTDEDELVTTKPKYLEFNKECGIKNSQFKIGMKFKNFKQFKGVVQYYGIRNRYVMNFKLNSKKGAKHFVRGWPFYLWASLMVKEGNTVRIKSKHLKHKCARDHNNRHVNDSKHIF